MCRFVESICLRDGKFERLEYHQHRMNQAFLKFFPGTEIPQLSDVLLQQDFPVEGIYKCRVEYGSVIELIEFQSYNRRIVQTLRLMQINIPSADFKSLNREAINEAFDKRNGCDDVLMVRDGLITDASYSNVAFFDGKKWFTPQLPLIYGTRRANLIDLKMIEEAKISVKDIYKYLTIRLFNAMIEFGQVELPVSAIFTEE
jgi:4-amino-4-deoxychorismate lyase